MRLKVAAPVEREVMDGAAPLMGTKNFPGPTAHDDLTLRRVPLLLAAVVRPPLFFRPLYGRPGDIDHDELDPVAGGLKFLLAGQRRVGS